MNRTSVGGMLAAVLATAVAIAVLAGCGTSTAPAAAPMSASQAAHDDADVAFVQGMIPHHTEAVAMAQLAAGHTSNPKILDLATRIEQAQGPEIARMQGFLQSWGAPAAGMDGMSGMDHAMPGMMSDQQMQQLGAAQGAAFDRLFLQMMTEHHQGALTMAGTELRDGASPDAKALAQQIIQAQQAEIATMTQLLATG